MDEDEAIRQCQAGDVAGLEVLYQNYHPRVFKFALANVRQYHLAEDIAQQVVIELFTTIKTYKYHHGMPMKDHSCKCGKKCGCGDGCKCAKKVSSAKTK